jgi:hypothetical protein
MNAAVRLYESTGWIRGDDLPISRGADRSYWLELVRWAIVPAKATPSAHA